ncbi:MAG TPA: hypothetical protein VF614_02270 [Chthoniobacteraceae bacterium]
MKKELADEVKAAIAADSKPQAMHLTGQPLVVEEAKVYVTIPQLNEKLKEVKASFVSGLAEVKASVEKDNKYLHKSVHDLKEDLQAIKAQGEVRGEEAQEVAKDVSALKAQAELNGVTLNDIKQTLNKAIEREIEDAKHRAPRRAS